MVWGPPPCLTMWRNPRVFGFTGASRAATPEPERALIAFVVSSLLCVSTASTRAAAIFALVACPVRHHQHAALAARGCALMRVSRFQVPKRPPLSDVCGHGCQYPACRPRSGRVHGLGDDCRRSVCMRRCGLLTILLQVVRGDKSSA